MTHSPIDIRLRIESEVDAADAAYLNARRNLAFRELGQRLVRSLGFDDPSEAVRSQRAFDTMVDNADAEHAAALAEIADRYGFDPATGRFTFDKGGIRTFERSLFGVLPGSTGGWSAPLVEAYGISPGAAAMFEATR